LRVTFSTLSKIPPQLLAAATYSDGISTSSGRRLRAA
jgi:hypothetical protein